MGAGGGDIDCPIRYTTKQTYTGILHHDGIPLLMSPECDTVDYSIPLPGRVTVLEDLLSGGEIIELPVLELKSLQLASNLETTKRYLVSDYITKYNQAESNVILTVSPPFIVMISFLTSNGFHSSLNQYS